MLAWRRLAPAATEGSSPLVDWDVVRALAADSADGVAMTDRAGRLVCANDSYRELFGGLPTPPGLPLGDSGVAALGTAARTAWRDGTSTERLQLAGQPLAAASAGRFER